MRQRQHAKRFRTLDLRKTQRAAFEAVIATFNDIRSVQGTAPAKDYSLITGGSGAKFNDNGTFFNTIDYTVDVFNAVKMALADSPSAQRFFERKIVDNHNIDYARQSETFMHFQERIGRVFIARGLYPVRKYFRSRRVQEPRASAQAA